MIPIPATEREDAIEAVARFLRSAFPGKELTVEVEPLTKERSDRQNKALFGHAYKVIGQETGLRGKRDLEILHDSFCRAFFGEVAVEVLGRVQTKPRRTTTTDENGKRDVINVGEFSAFYGDVERKAAEFGIFIPAPDPRWFME